MRCVPTVIRSWHDQKEHAIIQFSLSKLRAVFAIIDTCYDHADVEGLYRWAQRQFVDGQERRKWKWWSRVLHGAAVRARGGWEWNEAALPSDVRAPLRQLLEIHFGAEFMARDEELLLGIAQAPLSPRERAWLVWDDDGEEYRFPQDHRPEDVSIVSSGLIPHRAFELIETFRSREGEEAWSDLVRWLEAEADQNVAAGQEVMRKRARKYHRH